MALYTLRSQEEIDNMLNAPRYNPNSLEVYNAIGRDAGETTNANNDNFFVKRAKSLENAIGTTLAAPVSFMNDQLQNVRTQTLLDEGNTKLNDIYKKYGYGNADDYYTAANQEKDDIFRKYGVENEGDYWSKRYDAKMNNDEATIAALDQERADIIARMSEADANRVNYLDNIQRELVNQSQANVDTMRQNADDYRDYVENNYVSQKINQDRGKFLGSAINTLSTASDVLLPGAGVAFNAAQGAAEGIADELEQNGLENFDWDRAKNNAISGAVTGGVVGAVNKGLSGALAKNGGNLFKGGNVITKGLNNFGSNTALGRGVSTIATGAGRGAISGAVGGATGAGVQSIMNNADFGQGVQNALQGAIQGAQQGAFTGGIMAGANMAANKIPGVKNVLQGANEATENWKNSGENFGERLSNTWNSGDSVVANTAKKIPGVVESVADRFKNVGGSVKDVNPSKLPKDIKGMQINDNMDGGANDSAETELYRMLNGEPETEATTKTTAKAKTTPMATDPWDKLAQESGYESYDDVVQKFMEANPGAKVDAGSVTTWLDENPGDWNPNMPSKLDKVFEPNESDKIQTKNKMQSLGKQLDASSENQKYAALKDSLDAKTAQRAAKTGAVEQLADLDVNPENYLEAAKTSNYVNKVVSDLAKESNVKVNVPDMAERLSAAADDVIFTTNDAQNKFTKTIRQIVADGSNPDEFSASYLLEKSREIGNKAAKVSANTADKEALRTAYTNVKYILRDEAANALSNAQITGNDTNSKIAQGLAKLGANQKIQDFYTAPVNGEAPTISDYISRSSTFEQARDMGTQLEAEKYTRSASKAATSPLTKVWNASGLDEPVNVVLKNTVAPAAGLVTKAAGKVIGGVGNLWAKATGNGATTTNVTPTATATNYNPSTQIYNAIGRTIGENTGQDIVAANATPEASALEGMVSAPGYNTSATSVYDTFYGGQNNYPTSTTPTAGQRWANTLSRAMEMALNDGDYDAFQEIYSMYQQAQTALNKNKDYSNVTNWSSKDRSDYLKAQNGLSQIQRLEEAYNNAVGENGGNGVQGTLRQLANNISFGNLDPSAENYVKQANSLGAGIIKNLVNLGSTEYDSQRYIDYLPKLTDTKEQAKQKLQTLYNAYYDVISNLRSVYGL